MKRTILLVSLFLAAGLLMAALQGCKGPEGPAGPPGESKILQLEGFAADINCGDCHNPDTDTTYYVWAKKYQWEESKHFFGGDFERNSSTCAGCHTTEGYVQRMKAGNPAMNTSGTWTVVTNHVDASPPGCFACHSPHSNGDFATRSATPVTLTSGVTGVANATFDYGTGNLCVNCHQPRTVSPKPDPTKTATTDTLTITSSRWYPHYGVQSQMLMGTGGFQFPTYTYTGNSNHAANTAIKAKGCISCHMADAAAGSGLAGGHTMNIEFENTSGASAYLLNGCTASGCHSATGFTVNYIGASASLVPTGMGTHTAVEAYLDTLWNLLGNKGWVDTVSTSSNFGLVKASSSSPLKIVPAVRGGALFNYYFVEHDLSKGSHNTKYAIELLKSSIAEVRKP